MKTVIVIGAGPAGCTAAENLARKGYKVILFEKESRGRDKPCGGGVPEEALEAFPYIKKQIVHTTHKAVQRFDGKDTEVELTIHHVLRPAFEWRQEPTTTPWSEVSVGVNVRETLVAGVVLLVCVSVRLSATK